MEEPSLDLRGNVHVHHVLSLKPVVFHVVPLEAHRGGYSHWQVGEDRQESIGRDALRAEVVGQLVHGERHHVVDRSG